MIWQSVVLLVEAGAVAGLAGQHVLRVWRTGRPLSDIVKVRRRERRREPTVTEVV